MLSSDIGQAHCVTARYCQDNIPTEDCREAARRALRGRSGPILLQKSVLQVVCGVLGFLGRAGTVVLRQAAAELRD